MGAADLADNFDLLVERGARRVDVREDRRAYSGGSLLFHGRGAARLPFAGEAGTLAAFRAETTHEVTPVTHGPRLSIASRYR